MKTNPGRFFEDYRLGETIRHATPRTVTLGDVALYTALYGPRFAVQSSDAFARAIMRYTTKFSRWSSPKYIIGESYGTLRTGAVAAVRDRDVHDAPIPYLGGLAMLGGLVAAYLVARELPFLSRSDPFVFRDAGVVLVAGALICAVGVVDDIFEIDALTKLGGQVLADAHAWVDRSATRYIGWVSGDFDHLTEP